jgi:hypothetical protein
VSKHFIVRAGGPVDQPVASGTSGGNTSNSINTGSLTYPCVLDLLSSHNVTFKNYNFYCPDNYSILALFEKWATGGPNNELNQPMAPVRHRLHQQHARAGVVHH